MRDPLLGQVVDGYLIQDLLGRGRIARVYRATEQTMQRDVAFKVLRASGLQSGGGSARFEREVRLLARLQHPAIVQLYNIGQIQGVPYIVQELLPGPTLDMELRQLHAQGRIMEPAEVQRIVVRLASALDYAHAQGIIHRDLKLANVMRSQHGEVMLLDFGIAKAAGEGHKLTQTGLVLGTPAYLAPEQCIGDPDLTHAVDIYALGIMLYELLAGRVPFDDPSALAVAMAHTTMPPAPIRTIRPDVPPAVEAVVLTALEKHPADRYASAGALAADLERAWTAPRTSAHAAATLLNPPLPPPQPAASTPDAPTRLTPALPRGAHGAAPPPAATALTRTGGWPRWTILGAVLLALVGGGILFGRTGDAGAPTTAVGDAPLSLAGGGLPAEAVAAESPAPAGGLSPLAGTPVASARTPEEILSQMHAVVDAAAGSGQTDDQTAAVLHAQITQVEQLMSTAKDKRKPNGNGTGKRDEKEKGQGHGNAKDKDKGTREEPREQLAHARTTLEQTLVMAQTQGTLDGRVAAQLTKLLAALPF